MAPVQPSKIFAPGLLEGQVVVVTGGGTGLGRAAVEELARCGATVVIGGRREDPIKETAEAVNAAGGKCEWKVLDVREEEQADSFVDWVLERHGKIDTLVNNAGGQYFTPAEDITHKGFHAVVRLNLEGTWLMTRAVAVKHMIPSGQGGKVFSVTLSPHHGLPGMAHSSAARAAVENLMRVLSIEWARHNIRLTAIASGHFKTDAISKYPDVVQESVAMSVPLGRMGDPQEQAWLIAFLASPAGDYYSGDVITLDGARDNFVGPWPPAQIATESGKPVAEERKKAPDT